MIYNFSWKWPLTWRRVLYSNARVRRTSSGSRKRLWRCVDVDSSHAQLPICQAYQCLNTPILGVSCELKRVPCFSMLWPLLWPFPPFTKRINIAKVQTWNKRGVWHHKWPKALECERMFYNGAVSWKCALCVERPLRFDCVCVCVYRGGFALSSSFVTQIWGNPVINKARTSERERDGVHRAV